MLHDDEINAHPVTCTIFFFLNFLRLLCVNGIEIMSRLTSLHDISRENDFVLFSRPVVSPTVGCGTGTGVDLWSLKVDAIDRMFEWHQIMANCDKSYGDHGYANPGRIIDVPIGANAEIGLRFRECCELQLIISSPNSIFSMHLFSCLLTS